jgi:hypothetical protein
LVRITRLRARRSGKKIVVTWHTDRVAKRQTFLVAAVGGKTADLGDAIGRGNMRSVAPTRSRFYRVHLRADKSRYIAVFALADDPPFRNRAVATRIAK